MKEINKKDMENVFEPENIKFINCLTKKSYCRIGLDNTFVVFKSLNNTFYLVHSDINNSIISYDLINNKKINEIKKAHEYFIISLRYFLDKSNKRDLILSMSCFDNNIKLWDIHNFVYLLNISNYDNKCEPLSCFLNDKDQNYIITINNVSDYKIDTLNFKGELIKEIKDVNNSRTYIIDVYYDKTNSKNYILTGNDGYVKSYDFNENKIYKTYFDKDKRGHHSLIIYKNKKDVIKLIESSFDGNIRIWDFHAGILLDKIKIYSKELSAGWIYSICLINNNYLFVGCYKGIIRVLDLNKKIIIKDLNDHKYPVVCIKKIYLPNLGSEVLISQGFEDDGINLYNLCNIIHP